MSVIVKCQLNMHELQVGRSFVAQHYLTVPNSGAENEWHSHRFELEVVLKGEGLNEQGYLVDIVAVEDALDNLVDRYRDATLNDLPEFTGLNPSIEHFSRICCNALKDRLPTESLDELTVRIWEDETAWASYTT